MASLPTRTTASFDAIKPVSSLVLLDNEFNQLVGAAGILNGGTTATKLLVKTSDATDPPMDYDQTGAGQLARWKQNGVSKVAISNNGQISSSVATGTSPLSVASTTVNTNLNADTVDGQHYSDIQAYIAARKTFWSVNWFIADPSTFPLNSFNLVQKAIITGAAFTATDASIVYNTGSASGSFTVVIRKHPLADQTSQTTLVTITVNSGAVGVGVTVDVNPDVTFSADDWVYPILTARSSPLQRDVSISLKGFQLVI